ncbi:unnamed protein product, partial [Ectocarpus sp. 12 AP-2014]
HKDTPPTLWSSRTSHTTPNKRSQTICTSNRVPAAHAFGWTWKLPMDRLPQRVHRRQCGRSCVGTVGSVVWPPSLKRLVFDHNILVTTVSWPTYLQELSFGPNFNRPIADVVWPASLRT